MRSTDNRRNWQPLTRQAHVFVGDSLHPGALAIDATAGNGRDLEFLCRSVSPGGYVYAFDVQAEALSRARARLAEKGLDCGTRLVEAGHEDMMCFIERAHYGRISAIMFNLGYLPGGDHAITTGARTTLAALNTSLELLTTDGRLTVLCYPGHPAGAEESRRVIAWKENLSRHIYSVELAESQDPGADTPKLVMVRKLPA